MLDRMKLTRNGDTFETGDLFLIAKAVREQADSLDRRGAYENSIEYWRVAARVYNEFGDYHSSQECRNKIFEQNKRLRLKHEEVSRITNSVMNTVERLHPRALRWLRKDSGIWTAQSPGLGKRATLQFTVERQGASLICKTSKSVSGHGFVPISFDTAATLKEAKLACERRLLTYDNQQP